MSTEKYTKTDRKTTNNIYEPVMKLSNYLHIDGAYSKEVLCIYNKMLNNLMKTTYNLNPECINTDTQKDRSWIECFIKKTTSILCE